MITEEEETKVIKQYTPMMYKLLRNRLFTPDFSVDDYIQEGRLAILKAFKNYNPRTGAALTTVVFVYVNTAYANIEHRLFGEQSRTMTSGFNFEESYEDVYESDKFDWQKGLSEVEVEVIAAEFGFPVKSSYPCKEEVKKKYGLKACDFRDICAACIDKMRWRSDIMDWY